MALCMEYNIDRMSAVASHNGTHPSGPIFNDPATEVRMNLSNVSGYVFFKGIGRWYFIGIDLRLEVIPQEKDSWGQIAQTWWQIHVTSVKDNHTLK